MTATGDQEMSTSDAPPPPDGTPDGAAFEEVKVYHLHTPFNPPEYTESTVVQTEETVVQTMETVVQAETPVPGNESPPPQKFVSHETELGRSPGTTTCVSCEKQVLTNVEYKVGAYAWIMCIVFILFGLVICCCIIPFLAKHFKDAYHTCPLCNRVLHIEKKSCC
ncbi:hypothetical protein AGOR_G00091230 [Albula goreensis]|uniref:LITAF domain-containing protein n=1 Tax=Albula goreensis TaxID=1534307 RepID=A0A8T3DGT6_9TELE|nr:hypothetical protein AGOR_G00091230 [Albula goreensis]